MARYTLPWRRFAARGPVRRTAAGPALRTRAETDAPVLRRKADLTAQVRQRLNLFGTQKGIVQNASPDGRFLEFRHKGLKNLGGGTNVAFTGDHGSLAGEGSV